MITDAVSVVEMGHDVRRQGRGCHPRADPTRALRPGDDAHEHLDKRHDECCSLRGEEGDDVRTFVGRPETLRPGVMIFATTALICPPTLVASAAVWSGASVSN